MTLHSGLINSSIMPIHSPSIGWPCDLELWPSASEYLLLIAFYVLHISTKLQAFFLTHVISCLLWPCNLHLLTPNLLHVTWATFTSILGILDLFVLQLWAGMRHRDLHAANAQTHTATSDSIHIISESYLHVYHTHNMHSVIHLLKQAMYIPVYHTKIP